MVSRTAVGWILDVSKSDDSIIILIKLDDRAIRFKQRLQENIFYILPKSYSIGQDLFHQLSRHDQLIKRIFWTEKYVDLCDKNKIHLIGICLAASQSAVDRCDYTKLIQKLKHDSRVIALYNIDLTDVMHFIYTQLRIPPTSKIKIEYEAEQLLSIKRVDYSKEVAPPPFSIMYIDVLGETTPDNNSRPKIAVSSNRHTEAQVFDGMPDPAFVSCLTQTDPDIVVFCGDIRNDSFFTDWSKQRVVIYSHHADDIHILELIEKSRFSYLPLNLAAKCGMIRLIESRITYELLQRGFVIPARTRTVSKNHELIRTLDDIVDL